MELYRPSEISALLQRHGFSFSKGLGQNFIIDPGVCPKMAAQSGGNKNDGVIEIGPGIGVLTRELAAVYKKVVSIELDKRLFPILAETLDGCDNVFVEYGDVMKTDIAALINKYFSDCERVYVCANLPYYITSPVIMKLLEERLPIAAITVMVQKEAADRFCAEIGSRDAGAVTVAVRYHCEPRLLFKVGRHSFMPSPKVDSAVMRLELNKSPAFSEEFEKKFFKLVKAGFNQRRKTLNNALGAAGLSKQDAADAIAKAGLDPSVRGEALTMDDWIKLAKAI